MTAAILLVEDDHDTRECIAEILRMDGFSIETAPDGRAAMEMLQAAPGRYGLMLLDLVMPVMSGRALLRELARLGIAAPPTVILSASRNSGADLEYAGLPRLLKPFDLVALEAIVAEHLRPGVPQAAL